jgi:hypothetical protein
MNISYLLYQAERPRSAAEQREADVLAGELAAAVARHRRAVRRGLTRRQGTRRADRRTDGTALSCAIPRPR